MPCTDRNCGVERRWREMGLARYVEGFGWRYAPHLLLNARGLCEWGFEEAATRSPTYTGDLDQRTRNDQIFGDERCGCPMPERIGQSGGGWHYSCSQPAGHPGTHAACYGGQVLISRWQSWAGEELGNPSPRGETTPIVQIDCALAPRFADFQPGMPPSLAREARGVAATYALSSGPWYMNEGSRIDIPRPGEKFKRLCTSALAALPKKSGKRKRHAYLAIEKWLDQRAGNVRDPGYWFQRLRERVWRKVQNDCDHAKKLRWLAARAEIELCENCLGDRGTCGCWYCEGCQEDHDRDTCRCENCDRCHDTCNCERCESCGETGDICSDCNRCQSCCSCSEIPRREGGGVFHGAPTDRYPRYMGVEIECGDGRWDARLSDLLRKWGAGCHDDGSIGLEGSCEVVTAPARGDKFAEQIDEFCAVLNRQGFRVDSSCGTHVHVDARDLDGKAQLAVVRLYSRVESALYSVVAPSRRQTDYTKPWGTHFDDNAIFDRAPREERLKRLDAAVYGSLREAEQWKRSKNKHGSRYHGLNINALAVHGTLEFRIHHGTVNAQKIKMWAATCSAIVEYGATHSENAVKSLTGTPFEILLQVVTDPEVRAWLKMRRAHFENMRRKGKGLAQEPMPRGAQLEAIEASEA